MSEHPPPDADDPRDRTRAVPWLLAALGVAGALAALPFLAELPIYLDAMRAIAAGHPVRDSFYPVGYPVALAPAYAAFGLAGVVAVQALLYAATLWLVWRLLLRGGAEPLIAGLATAGVALHPYLLLNIQRINDNALNVPLLLALAALTLAPAATRGRGAPVALGLLLGLFVAVRPNALPLALLPLARLCAEPGGAGRAALAALAGLATHVALARLGAGDFLFFPGNGPYNLFAGNNPWTAAALRDGYNAEGSVLPALAAAGIAAPPFEVAGATYTALTRAFVEAHPLQALGLAGLKLATLFRPDWQFADDALEVVAQAVIALPLPLWLAALALDRRYRSSRRARLVAAMAALYVIPFMLTNSDPRFRLPLDVLFLVETALVAARSRWPDRLRAGLQSRRAYTTRS